MLIGGEEFTDNTKINYTACDQSEYQQDVVIHRTEGENYQETAGGLNIWHIYIGNKCKTDYGDVRFLDKNDIELSYYLWPEFDSSSAKFCVKLTNSNLSGILSIWYGNENAISNSDEETTYLMFDHFNDDILDTTKWDVFGGGSKTISDSKLTVYGDNVGFIGVKSKQAFNNNVILQSNVRFSGDSGFQGTWCHGFFGVEQYPNEISNRMSPSLNRLVYTSYPYYYVFASLADGTERYEESTGLPTRVSNSWIDVQPAADTSIFWNSNKSIFVYKDYRFEKTINSNNAITSSNCNVMFCIGDNISGLGGVLLEIDYTLVRVYSPTPPSLILDYKHHDIIKYTACDQSEYQQDVVIHRSFGKNYQETTGGLNIWHIYIGENCKTDYGDVRFTDSGGSQLSYYLWPEYNDSFAKMCVKLTNADQRGILNIWYGNDISVSESDGDATYKLFDHFDGVIGTEPNVELWNILKGVTTATVELDGNGNLILAGSSESTSIGAVISKKKFGIGVMVEWKDKISKLHYIDTSIGTALINNEYPYRSTLSNGYRFGIANIENLSTCSILKYIENVYTELDTAKISPYPNINEFYLHRITWSENYVAWMRDSSIIASTDDTGELASEEFPFSLSQGKYVPNNWGGTRTIDYVLVRTYSSTPPSMIEPLTGCVAYWDFRDGSLLDVIDNETITNVDTSLTNDHLNYTNCAFEFESGNSMIWNDIGTIDTKITVENTGSGWVVNTDPTYVTSTGVSGFIGKLALILLFNRVLSPEELSELSKMLSYKYIYPIPRMERK